MRRSFRLFVATLLVLPILNLFSTSDASAALTATLVDEAIFVESPGVGEYDLASVSVFIDPATTNWIAWNDTATVSHEDPDFPGQTFLWGGSDIGTNDFIVLGVTPPGAVGQNVVMDANNLLGQHLDPDAPMNVIFGDAADAPDALRIDLAGGTAGTKRVFDEGGALSDAFTTAGTYEFSFTFGNILFNASHPDIYLLVDTLDVEPPPIPEPATLALFASALGGIGLVRRRRRPAS